MARKETIVAFGAWITGEENVADVLERIAGGLTLQKASLAVKQPYTCLHDFFHSSPERLARYQAARQAWADAKMDEAIEIADNVDEERSAVAKARLRVETRQNQAKAYHRELWGERLQVEKEVKVTGDAGLVGFAGELLKRLIEKRKERVIEATSIPALIDSDAPQK